MLGNLGATVMGGEAYVTFKPGLIDDAGTITDEGSRKFLQAFVDQFASLIARLSGHDDRRARGLSQSEQPHRHESRGRHVHPTREAHHRSPSRPWKGRA